jgi:co-chaperonin GroES (HSP10)
MTSLAKLKRSNILEQTLDEAFPNVDPGTKPLGSLILVQLKAAATRTKGGLVLVQDTIETESDNTRVAKVIAHGALAFKNRENGTPWPEGAWAQVGDYVRIGLYGGDRWRIHYDTLVTTGRDGKTDSKKLFAEFALIDDLALKGLVTGDPLAQLAYL